MKKRRPVYRLRDVFGNVVYVTNDFRLALGRLKKSLVKPTIYSARGCRHVVFFLEGGEVKYLIGEFDEPRKSVEERAIRLFRAADIARRV
jgi:hypothetical protein